MRVLLKTSPPSCAAGTPRSTPSPASESGAEPCATPDGPTTDQSGPSPAHASLSARQAKAAGLMTSGTYGQPCSGSSSSAALSSALESRLRQSLVSRGSTLFRLTWKARVTPSGRTISALRASALRTSDSDCSSWPTTRVGGNPEGYGNPNRTNGPRGRIEDVAAMAQWSTPRATDGSNGGPNQSGGALLASGERPTGSPAETESGGQLNPAHSRWLMGLPPVWDVCGVTAMLSYSRSRRRSSKPRKT